MGIFHEQVEIVNRTSKPLGVRFDGQDMVLEPNYDAQGNLIEGVVNMLPRQVVPYAKSQNVQMGSEDVIDPSSFEPLVGVKVKRGERQLDDLSYLEQTKELTRVKLRDLLEGDATVKDILLRGKVEHRAIDQAIGTATAPFEVRQRS